MARAASPARALPRSREPRLPLELRLAWRDVQAHRGRSALIATLIMLPVLLLTGALTAISSTVPTAAQEADMTLGRADALLVQEPSAASGQYCIQMPRQGDQCEYGGSGPHEMGKLTAAADPEAYARGLSPHDVLVLRSTDGVLRGSDTAGRRLVARATAVAGDAFNPLLGGRYTLVSGHAPGPGEAVIDAELADDWKLRAGQQVVFGDTTYSISGIARAKLNELTPASVFVASAPPVPAGVPARVLVYERGVRMPWSAVQEANRHGVGVYARDVYLAQKDPLGSRPLPGQEFVLVVIAGSLAFALVVMVCGAAFAVGVKEQRRQLGLLAATGAEARALRRVVRWQSLILGGLGVVAGLLVGLLLAGAVQLTSQAFGWPWRRVFPGYNVPWFFVCGVCLIGLLAAVLAAMLPARSINRLDAIAAVRTAEAPSRMPRFPRIGFGLILLGLLAVAAVPVFGAALGVEDHLGRPSTGLLAVPVVLGMALLLLGFLLAQAWLMGWLGRARLPFLALRLSLRDALRHRGRSAPSVGAVAVTAALAFGLIGGCAVMVESDRQQHRIALPENDLVVSFRPGVDQAAARAALAAALPGSTASSFQQLQGHAHESGSSCGRSGCVMHGSTAFGDMVGGPDDLATFLMRDPTPEERAAVADGFALVTNPSMLAADGTVEIEGSRKVDSPQGSSPSASTYVRVDTRVPARFAPIDERFLSDNLFLPRQRLAEVGMGLREPQLLLRLDHAVTAADVATARGATDGIGVQAFVEQASIPAPWKAWLPLVFAVAAGVLTLMIAGVTVALAMADARRDEATLAAVGGGPWLRRNLAAAHMLVTTLGGVLMGAVVGLFPLYALFLTLRHILVVAVPWGPIVMLLVAVPLLGACFAWCLTNRRLELRQRTM